jgi:hypothetical protein
MGSFHDSTGRYTNTETSYVELPRGSWTLVAGTALAAFSSGASATPGYATDDSEAGGIRWNDNGSHTAIAQALLLPADRRPGTDVTVNIVASKTGATVGDATTFVVGAFFHPVGAARDADADAGGTSSAMVGDATTKTVQKVTRTIASADIPDGPVPLTLTVVPTSNVLGADDVTIHSVYLEYERVLTPAG